jgi:hypothetical protein
LIAQRGLEKIPLHPVSDKAKQGRYFQFPSREMMLGNTKEGFSTIELERIEFIKDCRGEGV